MSSDGWLTLGDVWTYASATTFTVPGNATATYQKGTFIKLTQSSTVAYFVVAASSFAAGSTTVTITGGSDYTLANSAISANFYSYSANPQGWPTWFNYSPTLVGWAATPTSQCRFSVVGRMVTLEIFVNGTSNATTTNVALPITYNASGMSAMGGLFALIKDNGTRAAGNAEADTSTSTTMNFFPAPAGGSWTASGNKQIQLVAAYEI